MDNIPVDNAEFATRLNKIIQVIKDDTIESDGSTFFDWKDSYGYSINSKFDIVHLSATEINALVNEDKFTLIDFLHTVDCQLTALIDMDMSTGTCSGPINEAKEVETLLQYLV